MLKDQLNAVTAFAPASCANLAVGFDALGLSFNALGDEVTLTRRQDSQLVIESVIGIELEQELPKDPTKNTATIALRHLLDCYSIKQGFNLVIKKGIPVSSGLGGSAASAIAALVALNQFLVKPLSNIELAHFALASEQYVSGQAHADNIVPALFGGLTLTVAMQPLEVIELPLPTAVVYCLVVHPEIEVPTRLSRQVLPSRVNCSQAVRQGVHFASFISSLYRNDLACLQRYSQDVLIEQYRADLIPGFYEIQQVARTMGALMCSISGSGPSIFAWAEEKQALEKIANVAQAILAKRNINSDYWLEQLSTQGACVIKENSDALL
ncbi:homoserine kinase [Piscirickettsia salmonis]|nr:homoserine kinase [Piscirickettsia salmonis LF-89 = ATCC VR-1361]ALY04203.1 homoserine kinase [Piscirickettsia salmonis]AMA43760.1 homoserine kinase [Piscirickettsia salmonis]AOS36685.1 homoserine kinase [Piscirickettsia salmonis]APS62033.1 homoserine kinase [Piscirickettsia salmonis]